MLPARHLVASLAGLAALTALGSCGGDDSSSETAPRRAEADFPAVEGRSLKEIGALGEATDELVVSPAGQVIEPGENRFGFGVFTVGREPVDDADIALYTANAPGATAQGPFPATAYSLETPAAYQAESTSADPDAAESVYVTDIEAPAKGQVWSVALIAGEGGFQAARLPTFNAGRFDVPAEGEPAPRVHTPTAEDVGGDLSQIDTRNPPSTQHEDDLADVLGEKPVVLLFATPALCQSRVCGPVVDVAEQVKDETEADVAFIHMEIFEDNEFDAGPRPQVKAYGLPTEPWLFVIDREGRISTRIEGAFGAEELREAIAEVS